MKPLPMPNDRLPDDRLVIASCDRENGQYDLLVLNPAPPFYSVAVFDASDLSLVDQDDHRNVIPAAEDYSDAIGGY